MARERKKESQGEKQPGLGKPSTALIPSLRRVMALKGP